MDCSTRVVFDRRRSFMQVARKSMHSRLIQQGSWGRQVRKRRAQWPARGCSWRGGQRRGSRHRFSDASQGKEEASRGQSGSTVWWRRFRGAVYAEDSAVTIEDSLFTFNVAQGAASAKGGFAAGGGILLFNSSGSINRTRIVGNRAKGGDSTGQQLTGTGVAAGCTCGAAIRR